MQVSIKGPPLWFDSSFSSHFLSTAVVGLVYAAVSISCFFFSSRRRHTRFDCDWSSDVCSSDLRVQSLARPTCQGAEFRNSPRGGSHEDRLTNIKSHPTQFGVRENTASSRRQDRKSVV